MFADEVIKDEFLLQWEEGRNMERTHPDRTQPRGDRGGQRWERCGCRRRGPAIFRSGRRKEGFSTKIFGGRVPC